MLPEVLEGILQPRHGERVVLVTSDGFDLGGVWGRNLIYDGRRKVVVWRSEDDRSVYYLDPTSVVRIETSGPEKSR